MFTTKRDTHEEIKKEESKQTVTEIIEEIHDSFYTEVDKLLTDAKISHSLDTDKQGLVDKCERLKALGFTNTKEVKEARVEMDRLDKLRKKNQEKEYLIQAIVYFSTKYPLYKFITEESVNKICEKYGLIYGVISKYIGTVPEKNIKQMEQFKVHDEDKCYEAFRHTGGFSATGAFPETVKVWVSAEELKEMGDNPTPSYSNSSPYKLTDLEIVAPIKDFDTVGMEVRDNKLMEIPDPVVLHPVVYKNQKHYLIVTAWGDEASDELVVNEKMN